MFQKFSIILLAAFIISFGGDCLRNAAFAYDRAPAQYQPPDRIEGKKRPVNRTPVYPRAQSREADRYQPHPITNSGESWEDHQHYYLSKEDERYLLNAMKGDLSIPTIKLPSGLVVNLLFIRTPTGTTDPVTRQPLYHTTYRPAKAVKILP